MLQTMRDNAQGMIAKVIVTFIIFVFALWGVESIVNLGGGEKAAVTVGGEEISEADIARVVEQQKANLRRQFGDQYDENLFNEKFLRQSAIEQLIDQNVALAQAKRMGLYASTRAIDEAIVTIPAFQQEGRFNKEQFQSILRMNGMTPLSFRAAMADDIKTDQARAAFILSSIETPVSVQMAEALNNELRTFSFYEVNARDLEADIAVSDEDAQAAYEDTKDRYKTPEQVSIRYVELSQNDLAEQQDVSDDEVEQAYDDYRAAELQKEQRAASHILIEVNDSRSDEEAEALAQDIRQRLDNGEDFVALAKEYSDDIGTSNNGGSLGLAARGSYVDEFERALYSLKKGEISQPVKTDYGYHIIREDDIVKPEVKALADVRSELENEIRQAKAGEEYVARQQELSNISFSAESVDDVAAALGLKVKETALFTRQSGEGVAANDAVRETAFSDPVMLDKQISDVVSTESGALVMAVKEHIDASVLPFALVKDKVVAGIKRERALEQAQALATQIAAGDESAEKWQQVSATYAQSSEAPRMAQQKAFALTEGNSGVVKTPGGYTVVRLDAVDAKSWQDMADNEETRENERAQNSRADLMSYQFWAKSVTEIERSGSDS
ncbi:MAG: SurA N-terminal domain-containing protein [Pseudomonadota bacterium]|nr:SurA N-terminal domain-containing protein [Pseudomonadota bacterium]